MINRNVSSTQANGMMGGPRGKKGTYLMGNLAETSGITYGGQGLGWYWQGYPSVIGGMTEYDPSALMPGSNMEAVQQSEVSTSKVGGGAAQAEIPDYGGTAAY